MWAMMGKWVIYTHVVEKQRGKPDRRGYYLVTHPAIEQPGTGMIIGRRWLQDGRVSHESETGEYGGVLGEWSEWTPRKGAVVPVYVVVKNDRSNPIWVSLDGIEVEDDR